MKTILFQGDSITDAGRDYRNYHDLGEGYAFRAAKSIRETFPDVEFEFINQGISGNRTGELFDRLNPDAISLQPDIISIMIGINDVYHRYNKRKIQTSDEQIEANYRNILIQLRKQTNAKILILSPYLLDFPDRQFIREDINRVIAIVERLAKQYADAYVPLADHFEKAVASQPEPLYYSKDAIHPTENGAALISKYYFEAIAPLIQSCL